MTTSYLPETPASKKILMLVPAYNEEESIGEVIKKIRAIYPEVLVYDDGSIESVS